MKIEWLKSRAWVNQWREEVLLLKEEMRRTWASFQATAVDWETRSGWPGLDHQMAEGMCAYASCQCAIYLALDSHFNAIWAGKGVVVDAPKSDVDSESDTEEMDDECACRTACGGGCTNDIDRNYI